MKNREKKLLNTRQARSRRVRASLSISEKRPRLSVFRSHKHFRAQIIDTKGLVLVSASDAEIKEKNKGVEIALAVGKLIASKAKEKSITMVAFDKGPYAYHGRVKAFADGAREEGLIF